MLDKRLFAFLLVCLVGACSRPSPRPVTTAPEAGLAGIPAPDAQGPTAPIDDTHLTHIYSPVSGRIARVLSAVGDHVHKGDPLAAVEAEGDIDSHHGCRRAKARLAAATKEAKRFKELHETIDPSVADYEAMEDRYRAARREQDLCMKMAGLYDPIGSAADDGAVTYTVRAPVDGELLVVFAAPGMQVASENGDQPRTDLFVIGSTALP